MKSEQSLKSAVEAELLWDPLVNSAHIGVSAKDGVVELDGRVETYYEKWAAGRAALRVADVHAIANELRVDFGSTGGKTDEDIARAASHGLQWNNLVPPTVKVRVSSGLVTLEGPVEWRFQKDEAENSVRTLKGVKGVLNEIAIRSPVDPVGLKLKIEAALKRSAAIDASKVTIEVNGGTVTLRGTVKSWSERDEAERATWSAPGVAAVVDLIMLSSAASAGF